MIKSDRWIKSMSMAPLFVVTMAGAPPGSNNIPAPNETHTYLSHETKMILDVRKHRGEIIDFRQVTQEDLGNWVPMISDFEPKNIREIERNGTDDEFRLMRAGGAEMLRKQIGGSVQSMRVDPLLGLQIRQKILSYGTSSFGYDVTLQDEFRIFTNINNTIIDPLDFDERCLQEFKGDVCIIPPNSYILGVTREYFKIPRDVMVMCVGKSTYARCGAIVNVTPIEPGFEGNVVIEVSNSTNLPMKIYANQGIAQFMFFQSDEECEVSYADKAGKYQKQTGMTLAKV